MDDTTNRNVQIGNICVQWSCLEYQVAVAIWNLAGIYDPEIGKVMTASLDLKGRVIMAFKLAHITNAPVPFKMAIKTLQSALQSEDLYHRRNQAVHGIHFEIEQPGAVGVEMHRGPGGRDQRIQTDKELNQLGQRITELRDSFFAAVLDLIQSIHPDAVASMDSFKSAITMIENNSTTNERGEACGPS